MTFKVSRKHIENLEANNKTKFLVTKEFYSKLPNKNAHIFTVLKLKTDNK